MDYLTEVYGFSNYSESLKEKRPKDQRQGILGKKHKGGHLGVGVKCEHVCVCHILIVSEASITRSLGLQSPQP